MRLTLLLCAVLLAGCDDPPSPGEDAGAIDAGDQTRDSGPPVDAGPAPDSGPARDAGPGVDAGPAADAGPPSARCAPLPPPTGSVIEASPSDDLAQVVRDAPAGSTIVLADGTYQSAGSGEGERRLQFRVEGVTLRSASGDPSRVIIDGEYLTNEIVFIQASHVTIAELTITRAVDHLVHVTGDDAETITDTRLHRVRFIDSGEQFVKVNGSSGGGFVDDGVLACSEFELTDLGRPMIERSPGGCYTGGIDAHAAWGWRVHDNTFRGIYCAGEGLAEHAVHFWRSARDTLVENNVIVDCARGIGFGLSGDGTRRTYADDPYPGVSPIEHYGGVIRNNVIYADIDFYDTGIELQNAHGAEVHFNTVLSTASSAGFFSSIDRRFETTDAVLRNNLVRRLTDRGGAGGVSEGNLVDASPALLVDAAGGDFHLRADSAAALDQGVAVDEPGVDLDGEPRDPVSPDIGADER